MKTAYIYCRVSTEEQAENGKSIETQERLCRKWAKDNEYQIVEVFKDEGKSATTLNRPALQEMLAKCQDKNNNVDAIIVQDTDRLARNTLDHLLVKKTLASRKIKLISVSQPMLDDSPEGKLMDTMIASFNAFQSQITGRKTSKVLQEKAKMGWFPGGTPPLGYKNIQNPSPTSSTLDKQIIGIDEMTAPYVKKIFEMYATGNYNVNNLATFLNDKGVKSQRGYKIHPSLIANILKDEFYIGWFLWAGERYKGKHPHLISDDLYDKVQKILRAHNQNATRKRRHNFLLRGFLICADCGSRMWAEKHTKPSGLIFDQYFCSKCRRGTYIDKDKLEKRVAKIFYRIEISQSYVDMVLEKARNILEETRTNEDSEKRRLQAEKSKLEKAMHETEDSRFVTHTLTEEAFQRIYGRYQEQLNNINNEVGKIGKDHSKKIAALEEILKLAEDIGNAYQEADFTQKRAYLGLFFKHFKIKKGKVFSFALSDELKPLIENGSVRVRHNGLRG